MTRDQAAHYLAAFIDGEGWITCNQNRRGNRHFSRQIGFTNTDFGLFMKVVNLAAELGLTFAIDKPVVKNRKHSQRFNARLIGGEPAFRKFRELIPLQHQGKITRLSRILETYRYNKDGSVARGMAAAEEETKQAVLRRAREIYADMKSAAAYM